MPRSRTIALVIPVADVSWMAVASTEVAAGSACVGIDRINIAVDVALEYTSLTGHPGPGFRGLPVGDAAAPDGLARLLDETLATVTFVRVEAPSLFTTDRVEGDDAIHGCAVIQRIVGMDRRCL